MTQTNRLALMTPTCGVQTALFRVKTFCVRFILRMTCISFNCAVGGDFCFCTHYLHIWWERRILGGVMSFLTAMLFSCFFQKSKIGSIFTKLFFLISNFRNKKLILSIPAYLKLDYPKVYMWLRIMNKKKFFFVLFYFFNFTSNSSSATLLRSNFSGCLLNYKILRKNILFLVWLSED